MSADHRAAGSRPFAGLPPGAFGEHHNTEVTVMVSRSCILPGELMEATITGPRHAGITMVVGYADFDSHGNIGAARADEHGEFVWRFAVPLDAPPGSAIVLANTTGADWDPHGGGGQDGGGTGSAEFTVAAGQC